MREAPAVPTIEHPNPHPWTHWACEYPERNEDATGYYTNCAACRIAFYANALQAPDDMMKWNEMGERGRVTRRGTALEFAKSMCAEFDPDTVEVLFSAAS
jgi:hypothetical protein